LENGDLPLPLLSCCQTARDLDNNKDKADHRKIEIHACLTNEAPKGAAPENNTDNDVTSYVSIAANSTILEYELMASRPRPTRMSCEYHEDGWNNECHGDLVFLNTLAEFIGIETGLDDDWSPARKWEMQ
jgi:hypothetical protein